MITHRNTKVNKFGHKVIQRLHLWDDMWLDRRRILSKVFQPLDHFPDVKRIRMPNLQTRCKELTLRASWHSCISSGKHQADRTRHHQCCNHPYQWWHLKNIKFDPKEICIKTKDKPSSLIIAATEVLERLIDAANISRSWSKVNTYPDSRSAKSVLKSLKWVSASWSNWICVLLKKRGQDQKLNFFRSCTFQYP